MGRISALTELTSLASDDYLVVLDSSANIAKKISVANAFGIPDLGWTASGESWTYASATTITVPTDATTKYNVGMFIKVTQSTGGTKYGMIRTVASTLLTIVWLGGATLANEAITSPHYSIAQSPFGVGTVNPANTQTDNSNSISSVANNAIKLQMGWAQETGNNTSSFTAAVSFPVAFTTVLGVVCQLNNVKGGGAASSITDLDADYNTSGIVFAISSGDVTNSGFTANLSRSSGSYSSSTYYGFSWIAWGIV
jgi:hypothetical protein